MNRGWTCRATRILARLPACQSMLLLSSICKYSTSLTQSAICYMESFLNNFIYCRLQKLHAVQDPEGMWVTDSDFWETCLLVGLLGCLWLIIWRRMSIRSSQRRQRRGRPPPGNGTESRAPIRPGPSNSSSAAMPAHSETRSMAPDADGGTQQPHGEPVAPDRLTDSLRLPHGIPLLRCQNTSAESLKEVGQKRTLEAAKNGSGQTGKDVERQLYCSQSWSDSGYRDNELIQCSG